MSAFMVIKVNCRKRQEPSAPDEIVSVFRGPKAQERASTHAGWLCSNDVGSTFCIYDISDAKKVVGYQNTTQVVIGR